MQDFYPSRVKDQAVILPRHDAVVYSEWCENAPLRKDQADAFDKDGFLVLEDVFTGEEMRVLQTSAAELLAAPSALKPETAISEPGDDEIRSIFEIHTQSAVMQRLATDQRLCDVARFLLGDDIYIHQSRLNYKPGYYGKEFYWHSDFETWHVEDGMPRMRALSMSILLADNSAHNGPLMLMPGSHKKYVTCVGETPENHYKASLKKQEYGVPDEEHLADLAVEHGIVSATGKAGTVIIFDCNMMHGSNSNITPFPRANAFIVYNAVSNALVAPFGAEVPRPEFIASRTVAPLAPVPGSLFENAA